MSEIHSEKTDQKVWEMAIYFSRMWGVMETLEPLPNIGFENIRDQTLAWAREFFSCEEEDFVEFFVRKAIEYWAD